MSEITYGYEVKNGRIIYFYVEIDPTDNMCISLIRSATKPEDMNNPNMMNVPVYDVEYLFKYYINGNWYEDAEGTIPWTSSLL